MTSRGPEAGMDKDDFRFETPRLAVRPYETGDLGGLQELKSLPETHRYNYTKVPSREDTEAFLARALAYDYRNPKVRVELAVLLKEERKLIGFIGLKGGDFRPDATAEIYYSIHASWFGMGLGTEAVAGMLAFAFGTLGLHRVWAGAACGNAASWKIMEKMGMRRECHWMADRPKPGKWVPGEGFEKTGEWEDGYGYAVLREEFLSRGEP